MSYVSLTSNFTVVAVYDTKTGTTEWADKIRDDDHYRQAYEVYPRWDINRKRFISGEQPNNPNSVRPSGGRYAR